MTILVSAHGSRTHFVIRTLRIESEVIVCPSQWLVIACNGTFQQGSSCADDDLQSSAEGPFLHLQSVRKYVIGAEPHRFRIPALIRPADEYCVAALFNISDFESTILLCMGGISR